MTSSLHPLLGEVFAALDAAGVRWCLLRGEGPILAGQAPAGDIDLLVAPEDLPAMEQALAPLAVVPLESWGSGVHRMFYGYHAGTDVWVNLDVEPELDYGPHASFLVNWLQPAIRTGVAAACLDRRRQVGGIWVLDPDDAFWSLLLHCIVDKQSVAERHRARLAELAASAATDGLFGRLVGRLCPAGWDAADIIEAVRNGDWPALVELGEELPRRAVAPHPVTERAAALGRGVRRLGASARRMRGGRGFSVAVLGPDGAGKSTLCEGLASKIGVPTRRVYMGLWQGEEGQERSLAQAGLAAAGRPLKVWRRYLEARRHTASGRLVVFDRHVYDALLPPEPPHVWAKRLFFGFLAHAAPGPDLVLVLDLPSEVAIKRRPEENAERLRGLRAQYRALADRLPHAELLPADRTPDELRVDATERIWRAWATRRARRSLAGPPGPPAAGRPGVPGPEVPSAAG